MMLVLMLMVLLLLMMMMLLEAGRRGGRRRKKDGECTKKPEPQSKDMGKKSPSNDVVKVESKVRGLASICRSE